MAASLLPLANGNAPAAVAACAITAASSPVAQSSFVLIVRPVDCSISVSRGSGRTLGTPRAASVGPAPRISMRRDAAPFTTNPAINIFPPVPTDPRVDTFDARGPAGPPCVTSYTSINTTPDAFGLLAGPFA